MTTYNTFFESNTTMCENNISYTLLNKSKFRAYAIKVFSCCKKHNILVRHCTFSD